MTTDSNSPEKIEIWRSKMPIEVEMKLSIPDDETADELFSDAEVMELIW